MRLREPIKIDHIGVTELSLEKVGEDIFSFVDWTDSSKLAAGRTLVSLLDWPESY
jgi:hypothetical protein